MRRLTIIAAAAALLMGAAAALSDPRPPEPMNAAELRLALRRLQVAGTALYVGAHPDDENTAFLAWLARGKGVRTAYLSLTRGDGGQNLLGTETGEALGVIRTQELLAARRIDRAEQFFTRALDFGYSKGPDETLAIWGHDRILADVVLVIRRFRPDIIVTRFGTDGSGGHGHHTASAILAGEAFRAAADPKRFPEQLTVVKPWQAKRLLWNIFAPRLEGRDANAPALMSLDLGSYSPELGRAWSEIAGQSRSMHKSQGFGAPERRGRLVNWFQAVDGDPAKQDLFEGIDLSWSRYGAAGARVGAALARAESAFDPDHPGGTVPALLEARAAMQALPDDPLVRARMADLIEVIRSCAGLWIEAIATAPAVSPGGTVRVGFSVLDRSPDVNFTLETITLPGGAEVRLAPPDSAARGPAREQPLAVNVPLAAQASVQLPANTPLTQPYWLRERPLRGSFVVRDSLAVGPAENPPALSARVTLRTGSGEKLAFDVPVVYRWVDPVLGERYRPLEVVPRATCRFDQGVYLFADTKPHEVKVVVAEGPDSSLSGTLRLVLPAGWKASPEKAPVTLAAPGAEQVVRFTVTPSGGPSSGAVAASFETGGASFSYRMQRIDYPHIPVETLFPPAEARLVRADVRHVGDQIAYLMGSGDQVPEALRQMGFRVTLLSDDDVENADLSRFDAIVAGVRAYNTRPRLRALEPRLLDYVSKGGRLVLQYDTADPALDDKLGPWPFKISRDRVTVEEAEMRVLKPESPLLTNPNKIGADDFTGWVQERGLYYAGNWDTRYETVLSANDPGETPKDGGLILARYGRGIFIYTGLAWFRQLPAGVAGAYRLFANLVSAVPGS